MWNKENKAFKASPALNVYSAPVFESDGEAGGRGGEGGNRGGSGEGS